MVKIWCDDCKGKGYISRTLSLGECVRGIGAVTTEPCQICHGAGYTEEAVVKVSEVEKWAEDMANTECGSPATPYEQGMSRAGRLLLYWLHDKEIEQEAKGE